VGWSWEAGRHNTAFVSAETEAFSLAVGAAGLCFVEVLGVFKAEFEGVCAMGG
jgi:hypothetical protein